MIRFWVRELMGWLLIVMGLGIFYLTIALLLNPGAEFILEGPIFTVIGIFVFRGGIHLLKVAVAARVAMQTQVEAPKSLLVEKLAQKTETPWDW